VENLSKIATKYRCDLFISISMVITGIRRAQSLYFVLFYFIVFYSDTIVTSNRLSMYFTLVDPCHEYHTLNAADRNLANADASHSSDCTNFPEKWYRFEGEEQDSMSINRK